MPVEVERVIYVNRTQDFEVPVEVEKIVYINQTIEVEKVIEVPVEKIIIRETCGEDQQANHNKNGSNLTKNWGKPGYSHCEQPYVWRELVYCYKDNKVHLKAGGLGKLFEHGGYQTWVCIQDHFCGDPWFCWVYHETKEIFTQWSRTIHDLISQLNFILLSLVAVCPLVCSSIGYMMSACITCWCVCNAVRRHGSVVILFHIPICVRG